MRSSAPTPPSPWVDAVKGLTAPELLAPAGDFDRLRAAILYGADAVYLGADAFGMRAAAASFGGERLDEAVDTAHKGGVKVYLTCNTLARNDEIELLPDFLRHASRAGVDALIITDLGVMDYAKSYCPNADIHISTQAGIVNYAAANAFYRLGAKRAVLARELSIEEIAEIRRKIPGDMELECFVQGAMCVSFSGRCLLSNYLAARDSNRGDCAQPCRWRYSLTEHERPGQQLDIYEEENGETYILNSRDMCLIEHIPQLVDAGISCFKLEGRAKGEYYTAVVTNAYRAAIDGYMRNPSASYKPEPWIVQELKKISYREYCTGFYFDKPGNTAHISYEGGYNRPWEVSASVDSCCDGRLYCTQRNRFFEGERLEVLQPGVEPFSFIAGDIRDGDGVCVESTNRAMMKFSIKCPREVKSGAYLRKPRQET